MSDLATHPRQLQSWRPEDIVALIHYATTRSFFNNFLMNGESDLLNDFLSTSAKTLHSEVLGLEV